MVEFLIAFLPLFVVFLSLVQLTGLIVAKLVVQHAASSAVRAAVVVLDDDAENYGGVERNEYSGQRKDDIETAAKIPLSAVTSLVTQVGDPKLTLNGKQSGKFDPRGMIHAKLSVAYRCQVPLASRVVCGLSGMYQLTAQASLPNNGAYYEY
jgi:hypothetical protein